MNTQWRLFLAALRFVTHRPYSSAGTGAAPPEAMRFVPLAGIVLGLVGAGVYWVAAQIWPTSVAVVVSMLATALATASLDAPSAAGLHAGADVGDRHFGALYWVFVLLIKYNALMGLSAASVPFPLAAYLALGLIMVAGQAASRALVVSVMAAAAPPALRVTVADLAVALSVGLAPAALLGIPGLVGLVSAIVMRLGLTAYVLPRLKSEFRERLDITQQLTEACFYLGALATWKYI